ncbi:MAG: hypothetical protein FJ301_08115 [Planctomycetes bacterium]|nr:hypothetical protein [Planctomycetota bacterium]
MHTAAARVTLPAFGALSGALAIAAVAGVAAWSLLHDRAVVVAADETAAPTDRTAELEAEIARLQQRLTEATTERTAAAPTTNDVAATPTEAAATPPPAAVSAAFVDARYAEVLAKVDWAKIGEVTKEMQPMLVELLKQAAETGKPSTELALKLQELNGKLVSQVPAMLQSGAPGFGPNGAYTHPLFVANSLAATLAAGGKTLDPNQLAAIDGLVKSFAAENDAVAAAPRGFELERLLAETEMKDRFFAEVTSRLTPDQQAMLYPRDMAEYDGANLFGTGLMVRPYAAAIPAKDPADFARLASNRMTEDLGLDDAAAARVRSILEASATRATESFAMPVDATEKTMRMMRKGRAAAALRAQLDAMRAIERDGGLTADQLAKLRKAQQILVPVPR